MSRNYTRFGRYEQLFDQLDAAISRLESRCDKIERSVTNLPASRATYAQQACYDSRREIRTRPLPKPPPQPAQDLPYYSLPSWDPPGHRQQFGRAAYETLPTRRMSHHPVRRNPTRFPPYEQPEPYRWQHNTCAYNQPTCQETQGQRTFRGYSAYEQPPPSCWDLPRRWQPQRESATPYGAPTYGPPTCWESPQYVSAIPLGCTPPHAVESQCLSRPYLRHDPSSPSLPVVAAVPPSILTPPAPSCCPNISRDDGELLHDDPPPPAPILQLYNSDISEEEETLLEDKEDGSIGEVEKIIAPFNVAQMSSKDVENCWFKRGGACTGVRIIAYIYVDFFDGDVPSIVHHSTSLNVDARFIPPRNDTPYLSILGGDKGRYSVVRCVFDPGGDASPKLLLSTLFVASWFPP